MKIILDNNEKHELDENIEFIKSLSIPEQKELNAFINGIKFTKQIEQQCTNWKTQNRV